MLHASRLLSRAVLRNIACATALALSPAYVLEAQSWTPLSNPPNFAARNPLLLTDGTVIVQNPGSSTWWRLTPDNFGSYVNGTWSQIASLPDGYTPYYFASAVLPDGRVIVEGGEYLCNNGCVGTWTNLGAIYDPLANAWTPVAAPDAWATIGDAPSVVLPDGTFMLANCCSAQAALLNAKTLTWTPTGSNKKGSYNEEGWTLLPDGFVLTVDLNFPSIPMNSELYVPFLGRWFDAGSTIVKLEMGGEIGPAVLRPDGSVFATGATGNTSIYNTWTGKWTPGPSFPNLPNIGQLVIADGPAALLPDGNVLVAASPAFKAPSYFFEFDGSNLNPVPGPPQSVIDATYYINMLVLPTGQILTTDDSGDVEIYTAAGRFKDEWRPRILGGPHKVEPGESYVIAGFLFNGVSQGAAYGDDAQSATNYPLVRVTNKRTGHVFYSRTHDHSSMGVGFSGLVFTHFDVPVVQEAGPSELVVVANGIPSEPLHIDVR